ncbi:MAG: hypothetical protein OHK0029_27710 [Armatimonadaceae bacterium]
MPRCQRTFRRLDSSETTPSDLQCWRCPYCPEQEIYQRILDPDLLTFARQAERFCTEHFGAPPDASFPTRLFTGLHPECVLEPRDHRYEIYLQNGSDPFQLRLQIGHEMFHRVCSQGVVFHWTHEMLACLVSVKLLDRYGASEYAVQTVREYEQQADFLSLVSMVQVNLLTPPYPPGFYGRAYITGRQLESTVGWEGLCRLARCLDTRRMPDIALRLSSLEPKAAARAADIGGSSLNPGVVRRELRNPTDGKNV